MSRTTRRLSAAVAAVALGATALMGVAVSAASAAPSNIDPNRPRSLTIHKLSQPTKAGVAGDGSELAPGSLPADALPLNGVEFTVQQFTAIGGKSVDLATDAGWATIQPYLNGTTPFVPGSATLGDEPYAVKTVDDRSAHALGERIAWTVPVLIPDSPRYVVTDLSFKNIPEGWTWDTFKLPNLLRADPGKDWTSGTQSNPDAIYVTEPGGARVRTDGCFTPGLRGPLLRARLS
ncbi:hypothetical protein [Leucobacter sp. VD1]|uniref:hypothetical protein n=1 Tax=Leucobacter sp. VD1 TaxID=3080381 RepID=UPI0030168322